MPIESIINPKYYKSNYSYYCQISSLYRSTYFTNLTRIEYARVLITKTLPKNTVIYKKINKVNLNKLARITLSKTEILVKYINGEAILTTRYDLPLMPTRLDHAPNYTIFFYRR